MAEAWKESLKRIKRGEQRERELRDKAWPRYPLFSSKEPHMPMIALEPTIRNLGTVIRDSAKLYAKLLEATGKKYEADIVERNILYMFLFHNLPCNEEK